jgi:hypothetical protein
VHQSLTVETRGVPARTQCDGSQRGMRQSAAAAHEMWSCRLTARFQPAKRRMQSFMRGTASVFIIESKPNWP